MNIVSKLWQTLSSKERHSAISLLCLMLIGMVLEMLGIGLVIPALALMTQNDLVLRYPVVAVWLNRFGSPTHEQLVIAAMLVMLGAYAVKFSCLSFLVWRQASFVFGLQASLSLRLFAGYLRQPYIFHLQRNSAQLIRNIAGEVCLFTSVTQSVILLITEGLVMLGVTALLFIVEPFGTLIVVMTFGLAGGGFHLLTRRSILRWGEARQYHDGFSIQHLQQGLGGVKDVKLLDREDDFLAQYQLHNIGSAQASRRQSALQALPRLWLEFLAVFGLAVLVLVMIRQGKPLLNLMPVLGLFAAAAFRLMPSINRMLNSLQNVRYASPVINTLHQELCLLNAPPSPPRGEVLPFNHSLTLEGVGFSYPSAEFSSLCEISFSIPKGSMVGFIGRSGAGKSTLVDIILGLLTPDSGVIKVDGKDIQTNLRGWQSQIGYVPQAIFLTDDTLRRNVAFGLANDQIDEAAVQRAIWAAQLEEFVAALPDGLETVVGERGIRLSGGQRQRIGIARALYHDPPVLLLDEATSSLDTATERGVMDAVCSMHGEKTIIIVAHRLSTIEHSDYLFRLKKGRIVEEGETSMILGKHQEKS
ncbi:MAG: ABC transporter ATP-binding protein/permease [Proteobacteria bacterium]|nr:ABC transporter ATP-binding protein/permease [Pseudomonadota bacterium]